MISVVGDVRYRTISNRVCVAIFVIAFLISSVPYSFTWIAKASALVVVCLLLYRFNFWGGGDLKLCLAFLPAVSENYLLLFLVLIGLSGGVLAGFYLLYGYLTDMSKVWSKGLPYGIPVCLSGLLCVAASL
ncbi:hypothetical protein DZ860_17290 [Vibrio sinensis]|uniref:Prepilin type IV endopeptidase peptidase domain-containing protein n=1 Tax=Vibrio sinensis TaxID=2302434 RepID=A0A3A6QES4_9VIBR|nr:hypothetical protein DZ860_17290 [Vibrio sinensis]